MAWAVVSAPSISSALGTRRNGSPVFGSAVWDAQCIHTPA